MAAKIGAALSAAAPAAGAKSAPEAVFRRLGGNA
jgi:hypothetical protein